MSFFRRCFLYLDTIKKSMIIGRILEGEKKIKFNEKINCTNCKKLVPGGMQTGESYHKTKSFEKDLENFKKSYLCGMCRDKKRRK